ncbi:MAG TPA: hypothetical protein VFA87_01455 [Rhizomicrobium sp.]|nr:hypothetical protein [Rhizomicrobium sp.]
MTTLDHPAGVTQPLSLSRPLSRLLLVLGGFALLTVLFFRPWLAQLSSALIGPPEDNMQDFWNSWHVAHAQSFHELFFTDTIRFPEGTSLAYHSFAWPQVFVVALLARLFGDGFAALLTLQNLTLLASFPLAATAMFYLARHLLGEGRDIGAAIAGFVFAFNPWHVAQVMHHAHVSGIEFLPLFVLCYLKALEKPDWRWLAGAAIMQALSALSCWYFLFYTFYFFAFHLLYLRLRDGRWPRRWPLAAPALCTAGALLLLSPWLIAMLAIHSPSSLYYVGNNMFVADLAALVAFPPTHLLSHFGSGIYAAITGNAWEGAVYLGLVNLGLLGWVFTRKYEKCLLHYALGGVAFFLVIAAGEALHVAGRVTPLHLPGVILSHLPFFANVRTPARAMVMVFLFLAPALGYAVCLLKDRKAVLALVMALMLLDFMPAHLASTPAACPPALQSIANDPEQSGVLDLPRGYEAGNAAMMLSACHGHPIVAGETARQMGMTLLDKLQTHDLAVQQRQLAAAHVRYVILHQPKDGLFQWRARDGDRAAYEKRYPLVARDGTLTILQVY